ncbi:metabotropic glutamate receptor 2 [Anastrepha ludens]|uniref:metabotropic glutamate receptor 2 n=1 Tax=Anastrepha ludens TaxID=28586 RepID=UPI0023AE9204|nr:metabotropic glutamate receptor 2 [Anastrepha ludens]
MLSSSHINYALAVVTVQLSGQQQNIVQNIAPAAGDVAELMRHAKANDGNEFNEQVVGDINEQWGAAPEGESEMRWKAATARNFEIGNYAGTKMKTRKVKTESMPKEIIKSTEVKREEKGEIPIKIKKVNEQSATDYLDERGNKWLAGSLKIGRTPKYAEEEQNESHLCKQHKAPHHLRRQQTEKRSLHNSRQHEPQKYQHTHLQRHRYSRPQQQRYEYNLQQQQDGASKAPKLLQQLAQYLGQPDEMEMNNTKRVASRFPASQLAALDWLYPNDEPSNADMPLLDSGIVSKQWNEIVANSWTTNDEGSVGLAPPSMQPNNYTTQAMATIQLAQPAELIQEIDSSAANQLQKTLAEQQANQQQRQHHHHKHAESLNNRLKQRAVTATTAASSELNTRSVTVLPLAASGADVPLIPTHATHNFYADSHRKQNYVTDLELHAAPRSGRNRGRHVTLSTPLLPHSTLHNTFLMGGTGAGGGGGKVFRSLPDTEDFNYEQHLHRMLAAQPQRHWPVKREAIVEGDVILGGLMMVHSREDTIMCGPIMPQGGIQALEAMLYTIDRINEASLLPNITLGAHILDDCDKDSYGLEMAVDFIKGSISNIDDAEYHCNKTQVRKVISGVVGAASSVTSIQVANLLRLFRIPQVSFFSTSPELSNKQRFEYFSRTIPSDHYQVKAMVEIVKRMGWSYVSIIYEESNYGIKAFEELEELLARHNICIAVKEKLVKDSGVAEEIAYDNIVQKLLTKPRARGAIIFGSDQEVREVMRAVRRNNATGAFSWIGSDGWSARNLVSDGNEPEVEGTLSVQPQANPVKGFEEYFRNLTVENNQRNPWFVEFWEDHFQCRYPGSLSTPYNNYNRTCTTKERLSKDTDFEDQLQFVSDAVMAFAYALRDMHRDLCGGQPSLCDAMKPTKGADLLKYLRKVQFQGLSGDHFRFDANGDGPARYNIIHFKQSAAGLYHWIKVGEYYEGELRLNMTEVQFKLLHPKPPESVCSLPCERGQAKKYVEGESCCWHCFNCSTYQIRHPIDETQCLTCKLGTLPDATKKFCQAIPEVYLRPESAWAIGAMAFSATGILVTLFVVGVFVRHNDTPIVRASGRELSYILLAGILMCYAVTFALVLKPTNIVCAIQRFSVGFCFTVVYAALLTKTNRIARIFKAGKQSAKRPSFISPKSQLVICSFLIFIQILINGVWMVIAPSHAMYHHPTREDNMLVCDSYIDASYMIAFFYPILLIVVCTVYAVLTRKIPEAFNESKHIGFTMYTTCVIWLAFVPLYFGTANHVPLRITSMSVTISLSASVTVACLFSPKLYIILIRPERNVRQSMMPPRYGNMHRTAGTGPSSMMAAAVVTAATCAQEEKIQKHITPTNTEHSTKSKQLCEMATQTITITNIFANLDSIAYSQIPFADQCVPNSNNHPQQQQQSIPHPLASASEAEVVANNNKINQQQHGNPCTLHGTYVTAVADTATIPVTTTTTKTSPPPLHVLSNHVMLQQHVAQHNCCGDESTTDSSHMLSDSEHGKPQPATTNV